MVSGPRRRTERDLRAPGSARRYDSRRGEDQHVVDRDWRTSGNWRKSTASGGGNDCVFVRGTLDGVRDSKQGAEGPVLGLAAGAVAALVRAVVA
jgi:hypothetical protein